MSNIAVAVKGNSSSAPQVMTSCCEVIGLTQLSADTFKVELQLLGNKVLHYSAGQYLQLILDLNNNGHLQSVSYSIANAFDMQQPYRLELFIQNRGAISWKVLKYLSMANQTKSCVTTTLPMGQAFLQTDLGLPHLLVATGSGISQVKCLTEDIIKQQPDANVNIYWSNKKMGDFYRLDQFRRWIDLYEGLHFTPVLASPESQWPGRVGKLYEIIRQDFDNLCGMQCYLCGSPQMVYSTIDQLKLIGLKEDDCYSDVFHYAPR